MSKVETIQTGEQLERCPFPIPYGWFCIGYSHELEVGDIRTEHYFGKEWVLFRGEDGSVGMTDPFCPHLGAHLGHGGTVQGNNIRCPFHHWEFDNEGWCKHIPYAKVMPGVARKKPILKALPTVEKYGAIFAWYHPHEVEPMWELPTVEFLENPDDHVDVRFHSWDIGTCIQEMGENSVDNAHLKFLHGVPIIPPVEAESDGPLWKYNIMDGYVAGTGHGPGISETYHNRGDVSVLMFALSTPIHEELTRTRMMFTWKKFEDEEKAKLAQHTYQHSIGEAEGEESAGFESVDLVIWDNKKYRPKPLLCDGDGPIMKWREYFKQFYVDVDWDDPSVAPK